MTDRAALLATVLADPADDTPRLIYADLLEESGDPADAARAHFIRAEVAAAGHPYGSAAREPYDRLAGRLYDAFVDVWNCDLPGWLTSEGVARYRRGFVEDAELSLARFVAHAAELFAAAPVTTLRLTMPHPPGPPQPYEVFGMRPELARVTTLQLGPFTLGRGGIGGGWVGHPTLFDDLMSSPTLGNVRRLILDNNLLGEEGVQALCRRLPSAAFGAGLEQLSLADCQLGSAAGWLLASAGPDRLARLNLRGNPITADAAAALRARYGGRVEL